MDIENHLFLRQDIERLGIAPLTSMFWYAEYGREKIADWRPEVHDSDGLAIWNGAGERIWRPLNNPTRIFHTSYLDQTPKGFGLIQRDRVFDHYLDGVGYDRRPSTWVEPIGDWGKGMVQLVEIPTDDEIHDNIARLLADRPADARGRSFNYHYRLHWVERTSRSSRDAELAHVVATRMGRGGQPGKPRPRGVYKFTVEFLGGTLANLPFGVLPEPAIWISRGTISLVQMEAVPDDVPGHWRLFFDLTVDGERAGRHARVPAAGRHHAERDLALPVRAGHIAQPLAGLSHRSPIHESGGPPRGAAVPGRGVVIVPALARMPGVVASCRARGGWRWQHINCRRGAAWSLQER